MHEVVAVGNHQHNLFTDIIVGQSMFVAQPESSHLFSFNTIEDAGGLECIYPSFFSSS